MNVSYINFDKTKPFVQKQIGDGLPNTTSKTNKTHTKMNTPKLQAKNCCMSPDIQPQQDNKQSSTRTKKVDSEISVIAEKTKSKRLSKAFEGDPKQPADSNIRPSKKHRRES